jgi:E3 ubiquitin-protein ligase mind-bomb
VIEALLAHGGNPAETDDDGNNALHHAAAGDEPSVLEVIVKGRKESHIASNPGSLPKNINKNKPDQKESKKQTSLSATDHDSCDINARNKQKQTALHLGVQKGFHEVVRTLLILGAHPNLQDAEGSTPLHEAVKHPGHEDITALLLRHKADFTVNNNDGCNPIHLASVLVKLT